MMRLIVLTLIVEAFMQYSGGAKLGFSSPMPQRIQALQVSSKSPKTKIGIAAFVNYGGDSLPMGPICTEGVKIALDAIQKTSLLPGYDLVMHMYDDQMCERGLGVNLVANFLNSAENSTNNFFPLLIGPTCDQNAYTGHFLKHYNFVGLADASIILEMFTDRQKYSSFYSVTPPLAIYYDAIPAFLKSNGWSQVFLLTETFAFWNPLEKILQYKMLEDNVTLSGISKVLTISEAMPPAERFQEAVRDLAAMDPRIIIVNTHFGATIACWLHRFGLYGPGYVHLFFGPSFFLPNSKLRPFDCTDEMLADVLQSVIYFSHGTPINLDPNNSSDLLGTSGTAFENSLKERIYEPELNDKWFFWRTHCYSETVGAALTLHHVEEKLTQQNDTLMNWVTSSDKFQRNGSYIQSIMREVLDRLHYKGLNTYDDDLINQRSGITGFFQMQLEIGSRPQDPTAGFKKVPVATYDSSLEPPTMKNGPGNYLWRTYNGHVPYDSLLTVPLAEELLTPVEHGILTGIAGFMLLAILSILMLNILRKGKPLVARSIPHLNTLILIGNALLLCFVLALPSSGNPSSNVNCITASFFLIAGFSLINVAILAKLHLAFATISDQVADVRRKFAVITKTSISRVPRLPLPPYRISVGEKHQASKYEKRYFILTIIWTLFQLVLTAIWFSLEPILTQKIERALERSQIDASIAYQRFTYACRLDIKGSPLSIGFLSTLFLCYSVIVVMSLYHAVTLRKCSLPDVVNDLHLIRIAGSSIFVIVLAGAAVILSFYAEGDPAVLECAVSIVTIFIVLFVTCLLFAHKLRRGYYL